MSLLNKIKTELILQKYDKEEFEAILKALFLASKHNLDNETYLQIKNNNISRFLFTKIKKHYHFKSKMAISESNQFQNGRYLVFLENELITKLSELKINTKTRARGLLIGAFLANGQISDLKNNAASFGFHSKNKQFIFCVEKAIQQFYPEYHFANFLNKRFYFYLYIKKTENIVDILKKMGAYNNALYYEDASIQNDYLINFTRINNLNIGSMMKSMNAANSFIKEIQKDDWRILQNNLNLKQKRILELRLKNRESSLQELAIMYEKKYRKRCCKSTIHYNLKQILFQKKNRK